MIMGPQTMGVAIYGVTDDGRCSQLILLTIGLLTMGIICNGAADGGTVEDSTTDNGRL